MSRASERDRRTAAALLGAGACAMAVPLVAAPSVRSGLLLWFVGVALAGFGLGAGGR